MQEIRGWVTCRLHVALLFQSWKAAFLVLPILVVAGWRRHPALLVAALVNLALHQLINHKEYRYIWLSIDPAADCCVRPVDLLQVMFRRDNPAELEGSRATAALVGAWVVVSPCWPVPTTIVTTFGMTMMRREAAGDPEPATPAARLPRRTYGNSAMLFLHADKPLFKIGSEGPVTRSSPGPASAGFNALLSWEHDPLPPASWVKRGCRRQPLARERTCLYLRPPGRCRIDEQNRPYPFQGEPARRKYVAEGDWPGAGPSPNDGRGYRHRQRVGHVGQPTIMRRGAAAGPWHGPAPFQRRRCRPPPSSPAARHIRRRRSGAGGDHQDDAARLTELQGRLGGSC